MLDFDASAQAAGRLLLRHGGRLDGSKLCKLLYLADRKAIGDALAPITGDSYVALRTGPAPACLRALAGGEGEPAMQERWDALFGREGNDVVALKELPRDWLSDFELDIIDAVDSRFGGMSPSELSEWTHDPANCPEWKPPQGDAEPIGIGDVLGALGFAGEDLDEAMEELAVCEAARKSWELLRGGE